MTNLHRGVEKHPGAPLEQVSLASCVLFARRRHAASAGCTAARASPSRSWSCRGSERMLSKPLPSRRDPPST